MFNKAAYGGALYVKDVYVCSEDLIQINCFFGDLNKSQISINFDNNKANASGDNLYGGLLDKCTIDNDTNLSGVDSPTGGFARFMDISNIKDSNTITSEPTQLCLCIHDAPICSQKLDSRDLEEGEKFNVSVMAVNQIGKAVAATINSSIQGPYRLPADQTLRTIPAKCYDLDYEIFTSQSTSQQQQFELSLYALEDPCGRTGISKLSISVHTKQCSCDPGFMQTDDSTRCVCVCDERLNRYKNYGIDCDNETRTLKRRGLSWICYTDNELQGYVFAPYCPFGYCQPSTPEITFKLNSSDGDKQCAEYREGTLCGQCLHGYGLSLGNSRCKKCHGNEYGVLIGIIIVALVAGIMLVFAILALNLTVAVGTLNSIVFYANVMYVHRDVYFEDTPGASVIVSWLNLDIGIDTCFFYKMDTYQKTWLQLLFPTYIILLVVVIIIVSSYSSKFSNIIGKRDPIATLATLLLLSYTRFLITVIKSFQFVRIEYANTTKVVWLYNYLMQVLPLVIQRAM